MHHYVASFDLVLKTVDLSYFNEYLDSITNNTVDIQTNFMPPSKVVLGIKSENPIPANYLIGLWEIGVHIDLLYPMESQGPKIVRIGRMF